MSILTDLSRIKQAKEDLISLAADYDISVPDDAKIDVLPELLRGGVSGRIFNSYSTTITVKTGDIIDCGFTPSMVLIKLSGTKLSSENGGVVYSAYAAGGLWYDDDEAAACILV